MNELFSAITRLFRSFQIWAIISPWEQALRVRFGKYIKHWKAGLHFKLPFADTIYVQTVRLRISGLGRQTITTHDGAAITFAAALAYQIDDIVKLYMTLHHAEDTLANMARSCIADYIARNGIASCQPSDIEKYATAQLDFTPFGIGGVRVTLTEFARVKTYRIIGDYGTYGAGSALRTDVSSAQNVNAGMPPS